MSKDKVISPTVSTKALMLICLIDVMENHDKATVNILGTFMQSDTDEEQDTFMKLEGKTVGILKHINLNQYRQFHP